MKMPFLTMLVTLVFVTTPGYAGGESTQNSSLATVCEDPRPQVCTMDYRPVCGNLASGGVKTYANGCGACSDAKVSSWVEGECPE